MTTITSVGWSARLRGWARLKHVLFREHYTERCYHLIDFTRGLRWRHHCKVCEPHLYHESIVYSEQIECSPSDFIYRSRDDSDEESPRFQTVCVECGKRMPLVVGGRAICDECLAL